MRDRLSIILPHLNPMLSPPSLCQKTTYQVLATHAPISNNVAAAPPHFTVFLILGWGRIAGSYGAIVWLLLSRRGQAALGATVGVVVAEVIVAIGAVAAAEAEVAAEGFEG
jgi:hypothetical protein